MNEGRKRSGRAKADAPGLAENLVRTWVAGDDEFRSILDKVLDTGRQDVIDLAVSIMAERHHEDAGRFADDMMENAEYAVVGHEKRASLLVMLATAKGTKRPDAADFGESIVDSGFFRQKDRVSLLPTWFPAAQLSELSVCGVRRLLHELADGKPPSMLRSGVDDSDNAIMLVGIDASLPDEDEAEELDEVFHSWVELNLQYYPELEDVRTPGRVSEALFFRHLDIED